MLSSPCDTSPRFCKVLIIGGRIGLLSIILSISSITGTDNRGSNCEREGWGFCKRNESRKTSCAKLTCKAWRLWVNCSVVFALIKRHWTGSCFNVHAIESCVRLQPSFSANKFKSRTFSKWRFASSTRSLNEKVSRWLRALKVIKILSTHFFGDFIFRPWRILCLRS